MITDKIGDLLTRIRNASRVKKKLVDIPASNLKVGIVECLFDMGYVVNYKVIDVDGKKTIRVGLKYIGIGREPVITNLHRVSRPGLRQYVAKDEIPRVQNGLGIAILSTSRGIMTGHKAKTIGVGGEVLCEVY